jgi:hypothetical protein
MAWLQWLLFLVLGVGLLVVTWQSLASGWLPFGPRGLRGRMELHREHQPVAYWLAFALYGTGGALLTLSALGVLLGSVSPLPLR